MKPRVLGSKELLGMIINSLERKVPFSVVSLGVTESFVLAQYTVLQEDDFLRHKEALVAAQGIKRGFDHRGVRFPNIKARDAAVDALKRADVIGYSMLMREMHDIEGILAEKVLAYYSIRPEFVFEANLRRVLMFSRREKFEKMLSGRKILLVCAYADEVRMAMEKKLQSRLNFMITGTVIIEKFEDIPRAQKEIFAADFDLCLLAAGINAVILAPRIAATTGKVAFDLGQAMESFITGQIEMGGYLDRYIGLEILMRM